MNVIIIGGGHVGAYIANLLIKNGCNVKVIESREYTLHKLQNELPQENIVVGSGTNPAVLEAAGISEADVVAAVTGQDEINLVSATIAKFEFGVPRVIARVNNPKNAWLFNAGMGVDVCMNQADIMSHIIVEEMNLGALQTLMRLGSSNYLFAQVMASANSKAVGMRVKDLVVPQDTLIIAVYRGPATVIPHGDTVIEAGDNLVVFAAEPAMPAINALFEAGD